ncbi:MAG: hypothetical protein AAF696_32225, partial [Bacteroidota bacterium]
MNLKKGQKYRYVLFTVKDYFSQDTIDYEYTGDTLELEVLEVRDLTYWVSEKFTDGSSMKTFKTDY